MIYIPANNNLCGSSTGVPATHTPGRAFVGVSGGGSSVAGRRSRRRSAGLERRHRTARVDTQIREVAKLGSMLATSGGLVFTGGTSDRKFHAFDASTGKLLWDFPTNSGILAPPTSFAIAGKQYIAVEAGWGGDARGMQATLNRLFPGDYPEVPEGGAVWVFSLN
jgi:alcohol dehydrogenase (cytochrome c)